MNKNILFFIFCIWFSPMVKAQSFFEGTWQGLVLKNNQTNQKPIAFWVEFKVDTNTNKIVGESRCESPFTENYAVKSLKGKQNSVNELFFEEIMLGNQKNEGNNFWCLYNAKLTYNDSTGYLSGNYLSKDCRSNSGTIILYKSKYKMSKSDTVSKYHSWVTNFQNDIKRGWKAYYVRNSDMRNFEIKPVYFDHDQSVIKPNYQAYLNKMVKIVLSHTDLRIKIIGHTDSNGSNGYNIKLSEKRAGNVKHKLESLGMPADRVVIEYRGENDPAAPNSTFVGKKLNRRVDFEFD